MIGAGLGKLKNIILLLKLAGNALLGAIRLIRSRRINIKAGQIGKYYKGGFERRMSRREAALILAIRESASKNEIKESHRRLMMSNHPDSGNL